MNYWIIPANPNRYRLAEVLRDMHSVDWRQHNNFEVGDIIYIQFIALDLTVRFSTKWKLLRSI